MLPYACLALGIFLDQVWDGRFKWGARGYLVLTCLLFLLFLPLYTAIPVPQALWALRFPLGGGIWTWFPTWI